MGAPIIGIDLGTTNSCVAILESDKPHVIHNREGKRTTPSLVAFTEGGTRLVGTQAKRQAITNPQRTLFGIKRLIGRKISTPEVQQTIQTSPFSIVAAKNDDAWIHVEGKEFSPQEISAFILEDLKAIAEDYLGEKVTEAVITVPAYFNDNQRQATKDAGTLAGLNVKRILNEPTAAALAYGVQKKKDLTLAVFDLGGGTFDISILELSNGVFEVLSTNGDTFLGGEDFDRRIVDYLINYAREQINVDLSQDTMALQRMKEAAEQAKHELSVTVQTSINLPFIANTPSGPAHLLLDDFSRHTLESLVSEELDRLEAPCLNALKDAGLGPDNIDEVILVGGMTRMPAVQERVESIFGKRPAKDVNPDEVVAVGAAIQSSIMSGDLEEVVLLDVLPHSVGIKVKEGRYSKVVERNTRVPCREKKIFTPVEKDQDFVNIEVYQGEAELVRDNTFLGQFSLEGLPRSGMGQVAVEVSFTINADGILNVSAVETSSGKQASVRIRPSGGLSKTEMDRILAEKRA